MCDEKITESGDLGFPGGSEGKESASNAGDPGSVCALGRSSGEGNGNPLQSSCLENPMDRGARQVTVYRVAKSLGPVGPKILIKFNLRSIVCFSNLFF